MKKMIVFFLLIISSFAFSQMKQLKLPAHKVMPKQTFEMTYGFKITVPNRDLTMFSFAIPLPTNDAWQKLESFSTSHNYTIKKSDANALTYLNYELKDAFKNGSTIEVLINAKLTKEEKEVNLTALNNATINKNTSAYKENIGSDDIINLNNPKIAQDIAPVKNKSIKEKVEYAYNLVKQRMQYKAVGKGLKKLDDIVSNFVGECGDYSTYLIALLRKMGIPARHVVGRIVENENIYHAWVEFYIDNMWISLDPTYPEYKGHKLYGFEAAPFNVYHRGINMKINLGGYEFTKGILQMYTFTYITKNGSKMNVTVEPIWRLRSVKAEGGQTSQGKVNEMQETSQSQGLANGTVIWAMWAGDNVWYHGKIKGTCASGYTISYDDGDSSCNSLGQIAVDKAPAASSIIKGTKVIAKWTDGKYYPGKIGTISGDSYQIIYDDGDTLNVKLSSIRLIGK